MTEEAPVGYRGGKSSRRRLVLAAAFVLLVLGWAPGAQAASGDLDPSFDQDGKAITNFDRGNEEARAVVVQRDGKVVAAGTADPKGDDFGDFALARYKPNGALDESFGEGGKVTTDFGSTDGANALIVQRDGKLVAAGFTLNEGFGDFALARYKPDGALDESFGEGGKVVTDVGGALNYYDEAFALVLQDDGKLVAAGDSNFEDDFNDVEGDIALVRYNPDGTQDESFDEDGKVFTDLRGDDVAYDLIVQPNDRLVVAGTAYEGDQDRSKGDFALVRYMPDGVLDDDFGGNGRVVTDTNGKHSSAVALVLQPDGKLAAAGTADNGTGTHDDFALIRYNPDGTLDRSFGEGGRVTTDLGRTDDLAFDLTLQRDGRLVIAGAAYNSGSEFALTRYKRDGTLDKSFGGDGKVLTSIGKGYDAALALAVQRDGKLIAAGTAAPKGGDYGDFALVRYKSD